MNYDQALEEIKSIILQKLDQEIPEEAFDPELGLTKQNFLDTLYTDIMALGYNFGDQQKAVEDIYEMQSPIYGETVELMEYTKERVADTAIHYQPYVRLFSDFHKSTQAGQKFEEVLANSKLACEKI